MTSDVLKRGDKLCRGDFLMAKNAEWKAIFQHDGNFVIYGWKPKWASNTWGLDATRLCMQEDCNLVMYNDKDEARWHTNTAKDSCDTCVLSLTDEGKLILERNGKEIWNSDLDHGMK